MTYPQQPQPYYPPQQQPQAYYPPQQPQQYYPPQPPAYHLPPEQQYAAPAAPVPHGSIDDFYSQPVGSGKSLTFDKKPVGFTYTGVVSRTITSADIQAQTDMRNRSIVLKHPDGRIKYVMIVPLQMQPSAEFPDGRAAWYVKGNDRTELEAAMERAGCKPGTPPEMGALITITYTGERPIPGLNPQKMKQVTYQRPAGNGQERAALAQEAAAEAAYQAAPPQPGNGADPYAARQLPLQQPQQYAAQAQQAPPQYAPAPQQFQPPQYMAQPQFQAPQYAPPAPAPEPAAPYQPAPQQAAPAQPAQPQAAPAMGQVPDLSAEQQELLARLTNQG